MANEDPPYHHSDWLIPDLTLNLTNRIPYVFDQANRMQNQAGCDSLSKNDFQVDNCTFYIRWDVTMCEV